MAGYQYFRRTRKYAYDHTTAVNSMYINTGVAFGALFGSRPDYLNKLFRHFNIRAIKKTAYPCCIKTGYHSFETMNLFYRDDKAHYVKILPHKRKLVESTSFRHPYGKLYMLIIGEPVNGGL